jgi:RNA-binding protein with serine-rich domain 1
MPRSYSSSGSSYTSSGSYSSSSDSSSPNRSCLLKVCNLSGNINKKHLSEIFSTWGTVKNVQIAEREGREGVLKRGYAYIEFDRRNEAEEAVKHMDLGQIDGNTVSVIFESVPDSPSPVRVPERRRDRRSRSRSPRRRRSPSSHGSRNGDRRRRR